MTGVTVRGQCGFMLRRATAAVLLVVLLGAITGRGETGQVSPLLFELRPGNSHQAAAVVPVNPETSDLRFFLAGNVSAARLICRFSGTDGIRAAWDMPVRMDLRPASGIRFWARCSDKTPVRSFSLYLKSGAGWYTAPFSPVADGKWHEIQVDKASTTTEGQPGGWSAIEAIRIAAWRGTAADAWLDIAAFSAVPADREFVLVRGLSPTANISDAEKAVVLQAAERLWKLLAAFGVRPALVEEGDLDDAFLMPARVVLLAYSPALPDAAAARLAAFQHRGGGLVGFYTIHPQLQAATGIRKDGYMQASQLGRRLTGLRVNSRLLAGAPDTVSQYSWNFNLLSGSGVAAVAAEWIDSENRSTGYPAIVLGQNAVWMSHLLLNYQPEAGGMLLLAMIARLDPAVLRTAASARYGAIGKGLPSGSDWASLTRALSQSGNRDRIAAAALEQSAAHREQAAADLRGGDYLSVLQHSEQADTLLKEAFYRVQSAVAGEFRAVWCHRGYGIDGWTWDRAVRHLRNSGFSALFVNMSNGTHAWYPSQVLTEYAEVQKRGDQLRQCTAAAAGYGIEIHVWRACFRTTEGSVDPRRLQVAFDGKRDGTWLCPLNPVNRVSEIRAAVEIAESYPVAGVHLDYIRYAGRDYCFCDTCRAAFEQQVGRRLAPWPAVVRTDAALLRQWEAFRAQAISTLVRDIRAAVLAVKPGCRISAAVYPDATGARASIGQDWGRWADEGWVDFVCPMNYTESPAVFAEQLQRQLVRTARTATAVFPGIGMSTEGMDAIAVIQQIGTARRLGARGFILFEYNASQAAEVLPQLGKGITRRPE